MADTPVVLFETEGSYPFHGGGVSTWSHILCRELEEEVEFIILALTGGPSVEPRYRLPANVRDVIHIPMWGAEEPVEYYHKELAFSEQAARRYRTTDTAVERFFLPLFQAFVDRILDPFQPPRPFGEILYGFWKYYQHFDYKQTLAHEAVWDTFKSALDHGAQSYTPPGEEPRLFDVTFGMRWLYHFMMPLAVPVPDVSLTHATLAGFPTITSIVAKYEYGIPILLTDHGVFIRERLINIGQSDYPFFSKKLLVDMSTFITRAVYHHADLIAPVTSVNTKWETRFEADEERIQPIYNGVDPEVFRPAAKPEHTSGTPTVVAAAQVFPLKDIETMIRSCHYVRQQMPRAQYILYGSLEVDPGYVQKCRKLVADLDLEDHFHFGGFHNTPSMIFNEGDISILSSISEGFPYTVIESMSCGRPVVSTDVGGIREALEGCGVLCKPRDARALAEGVLRLLRDDDLRVDMGRRARDRVLMNYTTPRSVDDYRKVYRRLHEQPRVPMRDALRMPEVKALSAHLEGIDG